MVDRSNATIGPNKNVSHTFVLLHGAWHDGSAWKDVKAALEARGHLVSTPTIAGHGPDAEDRNVSLAACAAPVIDDLIQQNLTQVVLVAHSFAGMIAPLVVEALPERIAHLVFLDALIPVEGQNAFYGIAQDAMPPLTQNEDGSASLTKDAWLTRFWHDPGADQALGSDARGEAIWRTHLFPESLMAALEPSHLSRFAQLREAGLPTTYLRLRGDQVFGSPDFWQRMVDRLPGCQVQWMDGSHEVLFTRPTELAEVLLAVVQPSSLIERTRQFYTCLSAGDIDGALTFVAPDFVEHVGEEERGGPAIGHEPFRQARLATRERLADVEVTLCLAQHVDTEMLFVHAEIRGRARESGQTVLIHAFSLIRYRDGLIAEHWEYQVKTAPVPVAVPA